jgi:hypothetical protein
MEFNVLTLPDGATDAMVVISHTRAAHILREGLVSVRWKETSQLRSLWIFKARSGECSADASPCSTL